MDIEKTLVFITENLADVSVKLGDLATKQARTDRQMRGLQTIVKTGMRMLAKLQEEGAKTRQELRGLAASQKQTEQVMRELAAGQKELAAAQKRTDERFQRWLDRGPNGKRR